MEGSVDRFMKQYKKDTGNSRIQMFDTPCLVNDHFVLWERDDDWCVRYCPDYNYLEILGANPEKYKKVRDKYDQI